MSTPFELTMKVRDYECDMEGIVNNAVYQNYLEHTRHEMILSRGISFAELVEQQIHVVVARADIRYKSPLRSRDEFVVTCNARVEGLKIFFDQEVRQLPDRKLCVQATFTCAALVNGRLAAIPELTNKLIDVAD